MNKTYTFATASEALVFMGTTLLTDGEENGSRNGRVKEILNPQIVLTEPCRREILTVNRKANVFAQIAETCWVLAGRNDIEWLSAYLPRAVDYSDDGKTWRGGYGPRLRAFPNHDGHGRGDGIDQIAHVVNTLRTDPLSRRAVIAIYEPRTDVQPGKDIPCNDFLQFQNRLGKLHLTVTVRSNDLMWGWSGINAFEWSTLQEIVASLLGIGVGLLTFNIGSLHLYRPHWEKTRRLSYGDVTLSTIPFDPNRSITTLAGVDHLLQRWFAWEGLCRTGEATLEGLSDWKEPLFRSWAAAIAYYWMRSDEWLINLRGTALHAAIAQTPASVLSEPVQRPSSVPVGGSGPAALNERVRAFYEFASELHAVKHKSYGDSWKKRGEKLSILANIARKVDRLGVQDLFESTADTWIDLMVYLAKYLCWLNGVEADPGNVDSLVLTALLHMEEGSTSADPEMEIQGITRTFDNYADNVDLVSEERKRMFVQDLLFRVVPFACDVWVAEQDEYRGVDVD